MRQRTQEEVLRIADELYESGKPLSAFAQKMHIDRDTLRADLKRFGLALPPRKGKLSGTLPSLYQKYCDGASIDEVAASAEVNRSTLLRAFKNASLPLKSSEQANAEKVKRTTKTVQERYGVTNVAQANTSRQKVSEAWMQTVDVAAAVEKRKATCQSLYGVDNPSQLASVQETKIEKSREKYGCDFVLQSPEIISKTNHIKLQRRLDALVPLLKQEGYELIEQYRGNSVRVERKHQEFIKYKIRHKCGHEFLDDVFEIPRCPLCETYGRSRDERRYAEFIESLGVFVETSNRTLIKNPATGRNLEVDIYLPERQIAFEYDGVFYHKDKHKSYHGMKTTQCLNQGVKLFHIWEHHDATVVRSRIKTALGLTAGVAARKTKWRTVSVTEANAFFEMHHLQGRTQAFFAAGLFMQDQMIAAISFRRHDEGVEIARFCNKCDLRVIGGFQKLFQNSLPHIGNGTVITYADRDWCPDALDSVYFKSGFSFEGDTGPTLFYYDFKNNKAHSRQVFQKHKLKAMFPQFYHDDLSANDILGFAKIYPLYNSGNWKFKKEV